MKKTFNINLAGYPFVIDDDAYTLLEDYLETIRQAFSKLDGGSEIVGDIESRIAEILLEQEAGNVRIITMVEVSGVISRIGQPEEIIEEEDTIRIEEEKTSSETGKEKLKEEVTPPPYNPFNGRGLNFNFRKRLFRDPRNAMLGGVCSGIAHYFNIDPTLVRILTVLLVLLSATTVGVAYIILWIVVPEARTPMQRMEMMGEEPTMENIGKNVKNNYKDINQIDSQEEYVHGNSFVNFMKKFLFGLSKNPCNILPYNWSHYLMCFDCGIDKLHNSILYRWYQFVG